jgi:hypothetical protein
MIKNIFGRFANWTGFLAVLFGLDKSFWERTP